MIKSYFDPEYPAYDGRDVIPEDEVVARLAMLIIRGDSLLVWHAENQGITVPEPNRSARINARRRCGMGYWVDVRGSRGFFAEVAGFHKELVEADFRNLGG